MSQATQSTSLCEPSGPSSNLTNKGILPSKLPMKKMMNSMFDGMPMILVGSTVDPMFLALSTQRNDELPDHPLSSAGYPSWLPNSMLVGSNPHSCWFPHLWEWNSQEFPTFGSEIPQNHQSSQKSTQVLLWTHKKQHFFATPNPQLQPGGESSWLPAETAEAPVDQLLPSLCESWAHQIG